MSMKTWRFLAGKMIHKCWIFQQTRFDWSEGMIKLATNLNQFLLDQCYSEDFSAIFQSWSQNSWAETETSGYNKYVRKCEFMRMMMDIYRNGRFQLRCFFFYGENIFGPSHRQAHMRGKRPELDPLNLSKLSGASVDVETDDETWAMKW